MLRKKGEKGFTLIELLIVIAIIGILAAIAIPMYRTQTIKAKMTEVTNGMSNVASAVAAYYQESETWPNCPVKLDITNSLGVSLGALTRASLMSVTGNGVITATVTLIDGSVDGQDLILTPSIAGDSSIAWVWSKGAGMPAAYLPKR
jgi:type IV pilus assembly protein PilA